jgi:uncharacterized protein YndB with AHSA1/START domain|tara:strand:+ start:164 stop:556 length:393 start_codon:yes stop_codon:yes gene_type:complete
MAMTDRIQFEMEFPIQVSQRLLYQYISTPSGLSEWFADNVNSRGEKFIFIWDDSEETANLVSKKMPEKIRFQWIDDEDTDYFFDLRIQFDEITKDVSLIVTDFAEDGEVEESKMLWTNQVSDLKKVLGSS